MGRYSIRILTALLISGSCYYGTYYWYHSHESIHKNHSSKNSIARLVHHYNEVQRKPTARVIWETLSDGETLYPGEAIRTTDIAEAKIEFLNTGAIIELEPDSLIVLEENEDGIALDFLKGNLFVKETGNNNKSLKLKSGKSEIKLDNTTLSLSKNNTGSVKLKVHKGNAELLQNGKSIQINKDKSGEILKESFKKQVSLIKTISPSPVDPFYIDTNKQEPVVFKWKKLSADYKVYLDWGRKRNKIQRFNKRFAKGSDGLLTVITKPGKLYWRLVAIKDGTKKEIRTDITATHIIAKKPPTLLFPKNNSQITTKFKDNNIKFKWASNTFFKNLVLEIATDNQLKNKVETVNIDNFMTFKDLNLEKSGTYYWRLTGFMKDQNKLIPVSSKVNYFSFSRGIDLRPPTLQSPIKNQAITHSQMRKKGVFFSWKSVPGIKRYKLKIQNLLNNTTIINKEVFTSPAKISQLQPGKYNWTVLSIDDEGNQSKYAPAIDFAINNMPKIQWAEPDVNEYLYFTSDPELFVKWKNNRNVLSWEYRISSKDNLNEETPWIPVSKNELLIKKESDGVYDIQVRALDYKKNIMAMSDIKSILIKEKPLLPSPTYTKNVPNIIKATKKGDFKVSWTPINGAKHYKIEVIDKKGNVRKRTRTKRSIASIKRLTPGEYSVRVHPIDIHLREGEVSASKEVIVPKKSSIKAPKLNTIKIK